MRLRPASYLLLLSTALGACTDQPLEFRPELDENGNRPTSSLSAGEWPASPFGVNVNQMNHPSFGPQGLDMAVEAGIGWIRADFYWNLIEENQGTYDWSSIDSTISYAHARQIAVLGVLSSTPPWANPSVPAASAYVSAPTNWAAWQAFVQAAANRYAGKVKAWNIWNEPNCGEFLVSRNNYLDYDSLVALAAPAIRNANAAVVAGDAALCGDWIQWSNARLNANRSNIDVISVHTYGTAADQAAAMEALYNGLSAPRPPLWNTEAGWGHPAPEADSLIATHLFDTYRNTLLRSSWWTKTFYFHYYVWDPGHQWGILKGTSLVPRPAYNTYRLIAAGCANNPDCVGIHRWWRFDDRLYGTDPNEGHAPGYTLEVLNYFHLSTTAFNGRMVPIYRCLTSTTGQHFLTTDATCEGAANTVNEGLLGYGIDRNHAVPGRTLPLYRLYYPYNGTQLITTSSAERDAAIQQGHIYQGVLAEAFPLQ